MSKIDFVPDEYIQQRESNRANLMYIALLIAVLFGMGLTFSLLKMRQSKVNEEVVALDDRLYKANEQIRLLDELEAKGKAMMKTALITAELPDLVPKSVILATLTNNLPDGVSLTRIRMYDKEISVRANTVNNGKTQFQKAKAAAAKGAAEENIKIKESFIDLQGEAVDDVEVADYIALLGEAFLFSSVGLVESSQKEVEEEKFRSFKLRVKVKRGVRVTKEALAVIREKGVNTMQVDFE
jgi:Tfp pilus assembly protein PilN